MAAAFAALCAFLVGGLLIAERRDDAKGRALFKPLASASFVLAALFAGALTTPMGAAIFAGLIFSALGDILLIPRRSAFFLGGMGAFALAHLCYAAGFVAGGAALTPLAIVGGGASLLFAGAILAWLWKGLGDFRMPVAAYSLIVAAMMAFAVAHYLDARTAAAGRLALAAIIFAISAVAVARDQFKARSFSNRLWGLPLYYFAQCLFALGVPTVI